MLSFAGAEAMASGDVFVGNTVVGQQAMTHPTTNNRWIIDVAAVAEGFTYAIRTLIFCNAQADIIIGSQYRRRGHRFGFNIVGRESAISRCLKPSKCHTFSAYE